MRITSQTPTTFVVQAEDSLHATLTVPHCVSHATHPSTPYCKSAFDFRIQAEDDPVYCENSLYYYLGLKTAGAPPSEVRISTSPTTTYYLLPTIAALLTHALHSVLLPADEKSIYLLLTASPLPSKVHVYPSGGHGFGLCSSSLEVCKWPDRAQQYLQAQGLIP
jgi:hypothetical protein